MNALRTAIPAILLGLSACAGSVQPADQCPPVDVSTWQEASFAAMGVAQYCTSDKCYKNRFRWQHNSQEDVISWLGPMAITLAAVHVDHQGRVWLDDGEQWTEIDLDAQAPGLASDLVVMSRGMSSLLPSLLREHRAQLAVDELDVVEEACFDGLRLPQRVELRRPGEDVREGGRTSAITFKRWQLLQRNESP